MKKIKQIIFSLFYKEHINLTPGNELKNHVVIITGASRGIGKSIADVLIREGANVVLVARDITAFKNIYKKNTDILAIKADVTRETDCKKIVVEVLKRFGRIDVLINNVGKFYGNPIERIDEKKWEEVMTTNVKSMFLMSKHTIPHMKKARSGLIVNMGSKISHNTNLSPYMTLYAASKYAVEGFSLALEKELKDFNIRVSCIMPATVNTVMSVNAKNQISTYRIGQLIALLIKLNTVTFQSIVLKAKSQEI